MAQLCMVDMPQSEVPVSTWQARVASDINAVGALIETEGFSSLQFASPIIRAAVMQQEFVASSLLVLCARAIGIDDNKMTKLYVFAAAIELINASLVAHAGLRDVGGFDDEPPLLSLGTASAVLLGDCLYSRAFEMIVSTRDLAGIKEIARLTERMITACTLERFPPAKCSGSSAGKPRTLEETVWEGSCSLAATLAEGTDVQRRWLGEFGRVCAMLRLGMPRVQSGVWKGRALGIASVLKYSNRAFHQLRAVLPASDYRSDLETFVVQLNMPM